MKKVLQAAIVLVISTLTVAGCTPDPDEPLGMAIEFTAHATSTYVALEKGWYGDEGLSFETFDSYVSGMALASALARGDIEVAYMCLVPAITAYANAGVPIKIVSGTHKHGYGLAVDPGKIQSVEDLDNPDIRIACVQAGGAVDIVFHKTIDVYALNKAGVLANTLRMNPAKALMAVKAGQVDAVFLPEQWCTMAEEYGFEMLVGSKDVWPDLQGSVLVVKQNLIDESPEIVEAIVKTDRKTLAWINTNIEEAAQILSRSLQGTLEQSISLDSAFETASGFEYSPEVMQRSIERIEFTSSIDANVVQNVIDYMAELGYISNSFPAEQILDLSFQD
ncbi:MAG: ABC transporter substrate-binding protein [Dehalococcoidaceae bacterium]|nr:ABC transporter substrate-binding protein [Dehalococcoidaceae bacterium]